ncbi:DUF3856 domain-containing protein [Prosthecochloris sp. CIB 2401]|uniref:DUF3856 domain-containing protein n=1 Tax=Prosthecochloris sp. CIB 2401 TaxID=1868325 RepID=UPI00080AB821|nr:DUF3856 domain-containing protein [Prosthecochloris sp. CIB 2401]ANT63928.1 putative ATPase [Prosthecochloris sp. CIB 2401]
MKPLKQVAQAYLAVREGDGKLQAGEPEGAARAFRRAMELTRTIPEEEVFEHDGFDAMCLAGLAEALASLGEYPAALDAADGALRYFGRRGELHQDEGKRWIAAVLARGLALARSEQAQDALKAFETAREMISERKGELPGKEDMLVMIEENIGLLRRTMPDEPAGRKGWWEFWS